jgi:uncharacterized damage-inducible protein DinB
VDRRLIDQYEAGGPLLAKAIAGLSHDELHAFPVPGTWSIHQIVIHMMDSDLVASERMKRVAAMDKPLLIGYDETAFANLPGSNTIDASLACEIFEKNRRATAIILRALPDSAFERFGIHNENGKVTLEYLGLCLHSPSRRSLEVPL